MSNPLLKPLPLRVAVTLAIILTVGFVDYLTGYDISLSIFYLLGIAYALWSLGAVYAVVAAITSIGVALLADWAAGVVYPRPFVPVWNTCITFGFYLIVIWLLYRLKIFQQTLESRIQQRTASLMDEIAKRQRLEKEILIITDREQQRIGHDIHDTLCQHLTATAIAGQVLGEKLAAEERPEAKDAGQIVDLVEEGIVMARNLARGLFPVEIDGEGLISALGELAATLDGRNGLACRFEAKRPAPIQDSFVATHLFRIAQEAARNSARHSGGRNLVISLSEEEGRTRLLIEDDGCGAGNPAEAKGGMGLQIMRHRARMIDASFAFLSNSRGTAVSCSVSSMAETNGPKASGGAQIAD